MALRSEGEGVVALGLAGAAYCRVHCLCGVCVVLRYWPSWGVVLVLSRRWEYLCAMGANRRHWLLLLVFCALLNTPRQLLQLAARLMSIFVEVLWSHVEVNGIHAWTM